MRLIDADKLVDALYDNEFATLCPLDEVSGVIDEAPTVDAVQQLAGELNHAAQCVAEGYVTWADIRQMLKEYGVETALE